MARFRDDDSTNGTAAAKSSAAPPAAAVKPAKPAKMGPVDGNEACARIAYAMSDVSFIYPITPATPMGELVDQWSSEHRKNIHGNVMQVGAGGCCVQLVRSAGGTCDGTAVQATQSGWWSRDAQCSPPLPHQPSDPRQSPSRAPALSA